MVMTILAMSGLGMFTPNFANAAASAGDLIKMEGNSSVYYFDGAKRFVFPNEATYFSWYSDFSGVVTIPSSELQSYLLGGNVVMRPGTKLVKITTDPKVYAVEANGVLRHVQTEAQAIALYGTDWAKRVVDVPDAFFTNYSIGTPLASGNVPAGSLVKNAGSSSVYYYDGTNYRSIASEAAMTANRLSFANVLTITNPITAGGNAITGMETALVKTSQNVSPDVVTTTGVMVSVSANTAVAGNIVTGQSLAEIGSFNFTASNDGAAIIKTLKLKRTGISSDSSFSNVYLFDGNTRLTDGASFSNGYVSFSSGSGLITVPAGSTKTITVKADVAGTSGNIGVSIEAASNVVSSAATVTGAFPLNGNLMSMMSPADALATVSLATSTTASSVKAGNTNAIVWSATAAVANKAVDFKQIVFKQIGSINADDLENLSLYVDGTKVATAQLIDNTVNFVFSPVRLNTGSHTIDLKVDIVKGSSRTFSFAMQTAANAVFTDTNYNINVAASGLGVTTTGTSYTISTGTLSLSADSTFNTNQIVKTASNAVLARFKLKAFGEDIKVNSLTTSLVVASTSPLSATSTETVSDFAIYVDGVQVGSSQTVTLASTTTTYPKTFGTTNLFTIAAGHEAMVEIKGSLNLDQNTSLTSVKANITGIPSAQGVTSYASVASVDASSNQTLTVTSGSLTIAKNSAMQDQNVSKNTPNVRIGSFILSTGSAEGVNVSNIRITMAGTADYANNISNLYIGDNTTPIAPSASNDFNVAFNVAANSSKTIDVYADLGEITSGTTTQVTMGVTYRTDITNTFANTNATPVSGQTLTVQTAVLADPTIVSNDPVSKMVLGGASAIAANYKFVATYGNVFVNELTFTVNSASTAISEVTVAGQTAPVVDSTVSFTGLNKEIIAGLQGTNLEVSAKYIPVTSSGQGGVATNATSSLTLTTVKYTANGVQATKSDLTAKSNDMLVVASIPTVALASDNPAGMTAGFAAGANSELLRFTVVNGTPSNPVNLKTITITPTYSGTLTSTSTQLVKVYESGDLSAIIGSAAIGDNGDTVKITFTNDSTINTAKTYVVRADTTGLTTAGNSIRLDLTSSDTASALGSAGAGDWSWNDSTVSNYANGYLLKNLPLQGNTMVK